jgi:hypothetical protein
MKGFVMIRIARRAAALAMIFGGFAVAAFAVPSATTTADEIDVFVPSAEVSGNTATFPLREGRGPDGSPTWFIVIEASSSAAARTWDVGRVNKLANVGAGAQSGRLVRGLLTFEGGVDFGPRREVVGSTTGFPPLVASPGSIGDDRYSPIVRLPDGSVINAPQVANSTGVHDKVIAIDYSARTVTVALTDGFARDDAVIYLSTDASAPDVAALEGSTFAPRLQHAPSAGDDSTASGRASLAAFVNGPTGADNPQRQGINSALLGEGDPLNVLAWTPNQGRYSPLWDVHVSQWSDPADARRVTRFADVEDFAEDGVVTGPGGAPWAANDVVVNCPIIAVV